MNRRHFNALYKTKATYQVSECKCLKIKSHVYTLEITLPKMDTMISEMEIGLEIPDCFSSFGSQSSEDSH